MASPKLKEQSTFNEKQGARWRHWDLHVHTPCSIKQDYGGDTPDAWEAFVRDLERLPADIVIGVNDYIFLDGYKKLRKFKSDGRLSNVSNLLPVVELRLDRFGGTEGSLSRLNLHVIFSDQVDAETIESQFINALSASYQLSPEYAGSVLWQGVPTRKSIIELGEKIKSVLPDGSPLHTQSPLHIGFSNLNVSIDQVGEILRRPYFEGKSLTAVGKAEWYEIKWNDASIAEKKTIINSVDMVFTAARTVDDWRKSKRQLEQAGVNSRLLDCSDAHFLSDSSSSSHLKIGSSLTWIKSDPTFEGLRHAVCREYDTRVFVGDVPSQFASIKNNPGKFIREVAIKKNPSSTLTESWFDGQQIVLNPGLVAIIGNKGSGKTALADILGLLGNCYLERTHFGFLNKDHFLEPRENKGSHFTAELLWESGESISAGLTVDRDPTKGETIKYIPQNYLEALCTYSSEGPESSALESELKKVILSHIPNENLLGCGSLDELIEEHTKGYRREIEGLRESIAAVNRDICVVENQLRSTYKEKLTNDLEAKQSELTKHDSGKPAEISNPEVGGSTDPLQEKIVLRIRKWQLLQDRNSALIKNASENLTKLQAQQVLARTSGQTLTQAYDRFDEQIRSVATDLAKIGVALPDLLKIRFDIAPLRAKEKELKTESETAEHLLNGKLCIRKVRIEKRIASHQERLAGPAKAYQAYIIDLKRWETVRELIIGGPDKPGSLDYLKAQVNQLEKAPYTLANLTKERERLAALIAKVFFRVLDLYRNLYAPVQDFIKKKILENDQYQLSLQARIHCEKFTDRFLHFINQSKSGSFHGVDEGRKRLDALLESTDFQTSEGITVFLNQLMHLLQSDHRSEPPPPNETEAQLAKGITRDELYNYIWSLSYIVPRFSLRMGDRPLEQLSPGEKGLLLLAFYLLLDKDCRPLVIDQPEENLDNETVHQLLVPCIKAARDKRQVILVTHNPNVAVVCDADQVIIASMHKRENNRITYETGAIENPAINSRIVDILEGTMRAFRNRDFKYHKAISA